MCCFVVGRQNKTIEQLEKGVYGKQLADMYSKGTSTILGFNNNFRQILILNFVTVDNR